MYKEENNRVHCTKGTWYLVPGPNNYLYLQLLNYKKLKFGGAENLQQTLQGHKK